MRQTSPRQRQVHGRVAVEDGVKMRAAGGLALRLGVAGTKPAPTGHKQFNRIDQMYRALTSGKSGNSRQAAFSGGAGRGCPARFLVRPLGVGPVSYSCDERVSSLSET